MAALIQSYEQQYSVLTADITSKIGRLKTGNEDNSDQLSKEIQNNFEEANDLLEQLELESRGAGAGVRVPAYRAELQRVRVPAYRAELQRVREEYRSVLNNASHGYLEEAYEDWDGANEQQRNLLDNTERLERSGKNLTEGYRVVLETEQIGAAVLQDLTPRNRRATEPFVSPHDVNGDASTARPVHTDCGIPVHRSRDLSGAVHECDVARDTTRSENAAVGVFSQSQTWQATVGIL
ncbi:Vesicle transport through interaction with t-SNAREs-like protein 1A [Operophtera brumata]|uniref:Vesicle transport through interaction with t-SNAREs-like protein 1A n=1 Tax=Operophtera brumata TaxID=104452 RepID=A0A0L7L6L3_OPEBR|nr:Vesicle transport through interaction with t-SNAREs-like protein 1A [Operophtera brumata]